jgi:hypothetical protein
LFFWDAVAQAATPKHSDNQQHTSLSIQSRNVFTFDNASSQKPSRPVRKATQLAVARLNFDWHSDAELDSNWRVDIDRLVG